MIKKETKALFCIIKTFRSVGKVNSESIINLSEGRKNVTQKKNGSIKIFLLKMPQMLIFKRSLRVQNDANKKCWNHNKCLSIHFYTADGEVPHFVLLHQKFSINLRRRWNFYSFEPFSWTSTRRLLVANHPSSNQPRNDSKIWPTNGCSFCCHLPL